MQKLNQIDLKIQINRVLDLYKKKNLKESKLLTEKLILREPNISFLHNLLGAINYNLNNFHEARECYENAVRIDPSHFDALSNLGSTLIELNELELASKNLFKSLKLNPQSFDVYINLGKYYKKKKEYEKEVLYYKKALEIKPKSDIANNNIGTAYISLGNLEKAKFHLQQAIEINSKFYQALNNLGGILLSEGDKENAILYFKKAIEINPKYAEAYRTLSSNIKFNFDDNLIHDMQKINKSSTTSEYDKMHINFALGKAHDDIGSYSEAFSNLKKGNKIRKNLLNYNIIQDEELFKLIRTKFQKNNYLDNNREIPNKSKTPIFIVGMPRSGTTLIEQIISSHSQVHGGGELTLIDQSLYESKWHLTDINEDFINVFSSKFRKKLAKIATSKSIITDKMPINFRWLGFILTALPEAKIVHIKRNAQATMWSIYKHFFSSEGNGYAYSINDI